MRVSVNERNGISPRPPLSYAVREGNLVFVSGQAPASSSRIVSGGFKDQVRQTLMNLMDVLESAGASADDVIKVNVYLAHESYADSLNEVYREFFSEPYPARTTICAHLLGDISIEVDCVALCRLDADVGS